MISGTVAQSPTLDALAEFSAGAPDESARPEAERRIGEAIADSLAVLVAGTGSDVATALLRAYPPEGGAHHVLRVGDYAAPPTAALVTGALIHAIDFDDSAIPAYTHPSSHLVAALLALSGTTPLSGADLIRGYRIGLQIENTFGEIMNPEHYQAGWHATGTLGTIAATGAVIAALRLPSQVASTALAISASMAGGMRANFGTMTKPLHAGLAARSAVECVSLAQAGYTASPTAMDARDGFMSVFRGTAEQRSVRLENLRQHEWAVSGNGLMIKLYPSCAATHTAIDAALELRTLLAPEEEVVQVEIGVCEFVTGVLRGVPPEDGLQAKFSAEYCVAAALARGEVTIQSFSDETFADPDIKRLAASMTMRIEPELADQRITQPTRLRALTSNGRTVEVTCHHAKGTGSRWPSLEEQQSKWKSCAANAGMTEMETATLLELLAELPSSGDVASLLARL